MVEKLNNILTDGSKHKKLISDQAVWVMPDSGNKSASWGNGGVWFPMAGRKERKDTGHPTGCHSHESWPHSLQTLIKTPKALISGEKKIKFSNCHDCKPSNTHRPMTSWKAHCLQLYVKPTFTHFPLKQANCYHNQETDLHMIKEGILNTLFTFINTKASSRTENQCYTRRRMQVSRFCNQTFCLENTAFSSVQFSCSVVSNSLQPHESQHARPPCPSPTPGVHPDSRLSSQWCHPAISSSVVPFFSCPQSLPASESFPVSQLFACGGQSTGVSASASFLPKKSQGWSHSEWTGWISLQSKGLSRVFSNTTVQKHQFFSAQFSSQSYSHIHTWPLEKP